MSWFETKQSILQEIRLPAFTEHNIRLLVKRDDLIDAFVSGNKWRKLKYIIELAMHQRKEGILTLGGAYSNHLLATAAACHKTGLKSIGLVRGEELTKESNANLSRCAELGMELRFISRDEYGERDEQLKQEEWKQQFRTYLFVPEGGATYHGLIGCQEILAEIPEPIDHVFVAQGTTTTSCGILLGSAETTTTHVVPVLKGFDSKEEMRPLLFQFLVDKDSVEEYLDRVIVHADYHFGGYAKTTPELLEFIRYCDSEVDLPLDSVYTAKAFYAVMKELEKVEKYKNQTVVFVHTGGLMNSKY